MDKLLNRIGKDSAFITEVSIRCNGLKELPAPNWGIAGILLMQLSSCKIDEDIFDAVIKLRNC